MSDNERAQRGGGTATPVVPPGPTGNGSKDAYRISYRETPGIVQNTGADWFGPLNPLAPVAPKEVAGRQLDYPSGYNLEITPRPYEPVKFPEMRALADAYDIIRLVIETRKDQVEALDWGIAPQTDINSKPIPGQEKYCQEIWDFFKMPDGEHEWGTWIRMLLEDLFVIDAPALYCHETYGGKLLGLEQVDGATIKRVVDDWGRTPAPPIVAYQQVLKGFPAVNYTSDELIYMPRNPRVHKFYGYSPVEQCIMTVNIALRRELFQLQYYTEGNVPEALIGAPDTWNPKQIQEFQDNFDAMLAGNQAARRRLKFIPGGSKSLVQMKEVDLTGKTDEWFARVVCFCFSISPQAFVSMMNRATADSAHDQALEEGLGPIQNWVKRLVDRVVRKYWPQAKVEFKWNDAAIVDPQKQMTTLTGYVKDGVMKANEARDKIGLPPDPDGNVLRVIAANGPVLLGVNDDAPTAGEQFQQKKKETAQASKDKAAAMVAKPAVSAPAAAPAAKEGGAAEKVAGTFRKGYWSRHAPSYDEPHGGGQAGRDSPGGQVDEGAQEAGQAGR